MSNWKKQRTGVAMRARPIFGRMPGYRRLVGMLSSLHRFQQDEVAPQRLKIIQFYDKHGEQATREAIGVSRQVISTWKKNIPDWARRKSSPCWIAIAMNRVSNAFRSQRLAR